MSGGGICPGGMPWARATLLRSRPREPPCASAVVAVGTRPSASVIVMIRNMTAPSSASQGGGWLKVALAGEVPTWSSNMDRHLIVLLGARRDTSSSAADETYVSYDDRGARMIPFHDE